MTEIDMTTRTTLLNGTRWQRTATFAAVFAAVAAGYLAGTASAPSAALHAEVTRAKPRETFQAGDQLGVPILKEIADTLKRIEARVEAIEKNVGPAKKSAAAPPARAAHADLARPQPSSSPGPKP
jgi:hypothetical protein